MQEYGEAALIFALTSPMGSVNISHVADEARSEYGVVLKRLKRTVC